MKVLLFTPISLRIAAGGEQDFFELASILNDQGHEVTIIDLNTPGRGELRLSELDVRSRIANSTWITLPPLWASDRFTPLLGFRALSVLRHQVRDAQLVIFNQYYGTDLLLAAIAKLNGKVVICSQANPLRRERSSSILEAAQGLYFRLLWPVVARRFDSIRTWNRDDTNFLRSLGGRASVIHPTIRSDWKKMDGSPQSRQEVGEQPHGAPEFKILTVGRMTLQKGIDTLAEIIETLSEPRSQGRIRMTFVLAGVRDLPPILESVKARHPSSVTSAGVLGGQDLLNRIREADVLLLPSRHETFGIVALEALSQGLPVVASNISGLRDALDGSPAGFLVPVGSAVQFCTVLSELAEMSSRDPVGWSQLRAEAQSAALERYGREAYRRAWEKLIQTATTGSRDPPASAS